MNRRARCYLGLIVARPDYLTQGQNKDAKRSISAEGFRHILWLLKDHPYPCELLAHRTGTGRGADF